MKLSDALLPTMNSTCSFAVSNQFQRMYKDSAMAAAGSTHQKSLPDAFFEVPASQSASKAAQLVTACATNKAGQAGEQFPRSVLCVSQCVRSSFDLRHFRGLVREQLQKSSAPVPLLQ